MRLVVATKFCYRDKDFHNISPGYTKRFVAAMCRRNMLLQLVARPVHGSDLSSRRVAATCRLVCTDLKWLGTERDMDEHWQAWQVTSEIGENELKRGCLRFICFS